jgi:uncharacterized protein
VRIAPGIEGYGAGGFRVAGVRTEGSILILDDVVGPWPWPSLSALTPSAFEAVVEARERVEFVLLGAGAHPAPTPRAVREALRGAGLGLEVMSTKEACRLYNVLAAEGRRIAAALIAVD